MGKSFKACIMNVTGMLVPFICFSTIMLTDLSAAFPFGGRPVFRPVDLTVVFCATTAHGKQENLRLFQLVL
jgi:hypothetical protein